MSDPTGGVRNHADLVAELDARSEPATGTLYRIDGVKGKAAYNPSRPFQCVAPATGEEVVAMYVRVESGDAHWFNRLERPPGTYDPQAVLYLEAEPGRWVPATPDNFGATGLQYYPMEDPFLESIAGELVFGGVRIDFAAAEGGHDPMPLDAIGRFDYSDNPTVTTEFYRGPDPGSLDHFATIRRMRDVRLVQLRDERILVATRPQGGDAGVGSIGLATIESLDELGQEAVESARLIPNLLAPEIKVAANELYFLPKGGGRDRDEIGVLAHTAARDDRGHISYFAAAFRILNPYTYGREGIEHTPVLPIARRSDWPKGKVKRPEVADVVFPAAVARRDEDVVLIAGLSDAEVGEIEIPDPFAP